MDLHDWALQFSAQLSKLMERPVACDADERPGAIGYVVKPQAEAFELFVMADEDETLVWLLNQAGRTCGPIWIGERSSATPPEAAQEIHAVVRNWLASCTFDSAPPLGTRDIEQEDAVNSAWESVLAFIESQQIARRGGTEITALVSQYIENQFPQWSAPFKHNASRLIAEHGEQD